MHNIDKFPPADLTRVLRDRALDTKESDRQHVLTRDHPKQGVDHESLQPQHLRAMVFESMAEHGSTEPRLSIREIENTYRHLARRAGVGVPIDELLSLKYLLSSWRRTTGNYLLRRACEENADEFGWAARQLAKLPWILRHHNLLRLKTAYERLPPTSPVVRQALVNLLHTHGDPDYVREWLTDLGLAAADHRLGPVPFRRRIRPYVMTRYKQADHWLSEPCVELEHYVCEDQDTVCTRGMRIQTGDVIVADLALPHEGLMNPYVRPRSHYTHSGIFLVLRYQGRLIPAVLEIHERGARLVPLNRFLSPTHTYYGEVYRWLENPPRGWQQALSREALNLVFEDQISYDFFVRPVEEIDRSPRNQRSATCFSLIELMFLRTGVYVPPLTRTQIPEHVVENMLSVLGLDDMSREYCNTTDLVRSGAPLVGVIDNDALVENLGRELAIGHIDVPGSLAYRIGTRHLRTRNVQDFEWWYSRLVGISQQNNLAGHVLRAVNGHTLATIPTSATPAAVAFYLAANRRVGPLVDEFCQSSDLLSQLDQQPVCQLESLQQVRRLHVCLQNLIDKHDLEPWFQ